MPKRAHSASDRDNENESNHQENSSKKTRTNSDLTNLCQELYDNLRSYKSEDGKLLCEHFLRLPSKRAHSDYFGSIKDPIDFSQIQEKLDQNRYETLEEFLDDFELLFANAKNFYRKNSTEWKDAHELSKYFYAKLNPTKQQTIDRHYFEEFFTAIYNAEIEDRPITDVFLFLPSRKIYPDYYLIVTKPIDLKMIAMKINKNEYHTLEDMENDLLMMISNARKYNDPKSQIYKDACALKKLITNVRNELESAMKTSKDQLRLRQDDVSLSAEVANMEYPEEPDDDEIIQQNNDDADSETSSLADEDDSYRILYNAVKNFRLGAQTLIDPFMKLPNRRFHQDYYEEIKRPIAMSLIKNHVQKGKYSDLADLVDDLRLMFDNAMQYNQEGSLIYNSAKRLLDFTLNRARELGYDEKKERVREIPTIVKEESVDAPIVHSPNSRRVSKKPTKTHEDNIHLIYNFIREYRENDVGLIAPFLKLPSAEEYPDYYETIEQPIDMSMIKEKIDKGTYKREQEIFDDFNRMFNNAKIYNVDESYIFKYASRLEQALATKYKSLVHQKRERFSQGIRTTTKKSSDSVQEKVHHLIQTIKNFTDRDRRILSTPFLTLPSKSEYPDYYEIITRPIDLKRIEMRSYTNINDLVADLQQMFDNACVFNEPGSTIYRDALTLQKVLLEKNRELKSHEHDVFHVPSLIQEFIVNLFIQTFNYEDQDGRYFTDSFSELADPTENEPFDIVYTFDLIRQNLDQRRYRRLDVFQEDLFKVFERARRLSPRPSMVYDDSVQLQKYYIRIRDELCGQIFFRSPALLFKEDRLREELIREENQLPPTRVNAKYQNSTQIVNSSDKMDQKQSLSKSNSTSDESSTSNGETYFIGDFVYIDPNDESNEPTIMCIESFERKSNENYFTGLQFLRPNETFHTPTHKFLRQEVFLTQSIEHIAMNKIQGLCHVLHAKDFFKYRPKIDDRAKEFDEHDIFVCESRYNTKSKIFKKIKHWNVPDNKRVHLVPRETILDSTRYPSTLIHYHNQGNANFVHRQSTTESESSHIDTIEKVKQTVPYDSTINEKFNENLPVKKSFFEQIVLPTNSHYKVGDYVYIGSLDNNPNELEKRQIFRVEKIWKENDSFSMSGPIFIHPSDIPDREHLINTIRCSYDREVIKRDGPSTQINVNNIKGKCSVLSLKSYCTYRLTEIPESDVFLCESKYVREDHSLRNLSKPLKRISLSEKVLADEIWTFRKELLLKQDTNGSMTKVLHDDASTMDIDESSTNHLDIDENSSSRMNSPYFNRQNNRKSNKRPAQTSRPPCGYLVFASEYRKRLVRDNSSLQFGEMSRIIGDQWRKLAPNEREKYEEKAREKGREQEMSAMSNGVNGDVPVSIQRVVNNGVIPTMVNGYHHPPLQNVHSMNGGILPVLLKAPTVPVVHRAPRVQRLVHSETYFRYIEHLKTDHPFISDWPKQLKASITNPTNPSSRTLPAQWFINNSPGLYNNVYEALWSMRDHMWSDVVRVRNVLSDEW